jgi:DnaJ-class molecular chaperone
MNMGLKAAIEDAESEIEELDEDSEERQEAALRLFGLEELLEEKEARGAEAEWLECGACHGSGKIEDYEDSWQCQCCNGRGGNWA